MFKVRTHHKLIFTIQITLLFLFIVGCASQSSSDKESVIPYAVDEDVRYSTTEYNSKSINNIYYEQYLRYIWIAEDLSKDNLSASFRIDKIDDSIVSGRFSPDTATPDWFRDPKEYQQLLDNGNNMKGEIINGVAECVFSGFGKGNIRLEFIDKDSIKAEIKYTEKDEDYKKFGDGIFIYRPYNIKDHKLFVVNKELTIETKLDSWGDVNIISGRQETNHAVPFIYLTNKEGDILYRFGAPHPHDSSIKEIVVEDMNGDALQDVKVITSIGDSPPEYDFIWNFYQLENGWFYMERAGYNP